MALSVNQKGLICVLGKSIDERSFGCSLLALYKSDARITKSALRKEWDYMSSPFCFDNEAM